MKYVIGIVAIAGALFMAVPGGIILWMGLRSAWRGARIFTVWNRRYDLVFPLRCLQLKLTEK